MNKLTVKESSELSLKKARSLLDVTRKILTPRNVAVDDDSWMERLWTWADEYNIDEKRLPRDKLGVINIQELDLSENKLTELPKEIVNLTNLKTLEVAPASCRLSIEQEVSVNYWF
jgi:Leucine-rich repeat (LRR) protein